MPGGSGSEAPWPLGSGPALLFLRLVPVLGAVPGSQGLFGRAYAQRCLLCLLQDPRLTALRKRSCADEGVHKAEDRLIAAEVPPGNVLPVDLEIALEDVELRGLELLHVGLHAVLEAINVEGIEALLDHGLEGNGKDGLAKVEGLGHEGMAAALDHVAAA